MATINDQLKAILDGIQSQITILKNEQDLIHEQMTPIPVEEYTDLQITVNDPKDVSLHLFKTLPDFSGDRKAYPTWRSMVITAMHLLTNFPNSMRFYEALMIVRNKIMGAASNILNNYNTPFNFDAIIDRLDFTYADKRPLYIIEQEMTILQQNKMSIDEFYDQVNEKLNNIINKINMSYKDASTTKAFIESSNEKALRTFITGLNNKRGEILYASNPSTLPEAYARLQTIINDQKRIQFANRYHGHEMQKSKNPRFHYRETPKQEPNLSKIDEEEPMEIDHSSTKVNFDQPKFTNSQRNTTNFKPNKRNFSLQNSSNKASDPKTKIQRIHNLDNNESYTKTIINDDEIPSDTESSVSDDLSSSQSTIFLDE